MRIFLVLTLLLAMPISCARSNLVHEPSTPYSAVTYPAQINKEVRVENGIFGVITDEAQNTFLRSNLVPNRKGQIYGWILLVKTDKEDVLLREELVLPSRGNWSTENELKVSADGRVGVLERRARVVDGKVSNWWSIADGDPTGEHLISISLDGVPAGQFKFVIR